jgi:sulfite reductase (NADPH) flavoprotein alpha-component
MLYSDRPAVWLGAAAAAGATLWLVRRRAAASGGSDPLATGFEAYLKNKEVGRKPEDQKQANHAPTSFEAYLRQPAAAPASGGGGVAASAAAPAAPPTAKPVTLLYGTEYGFSKEVAERAAAALRSADGGAAFWPSLLDMADLPQGLPSLPACQALLVVCSTQGDGVPPTEARDFCDWLASGDAPALGGAVRFSVCALGDRCGGGARARPARWLFKPRGGVGGAVQRGLFGTPAPVASAFSGGKQRRAAAGPQRRASSRAPPLPAPACCLLLTSSSLLR